MRLEILISVLDVPIKETEMGTIIGGSGSREEISLCQFCNFISIILLGILICAVSLFSAVMVRAFFNF